MNMPIDNNLVIHIKFYSIFHIHKMRTNKFLMQQINSKITSIKPFSFFGTMQKRGRRRKERFFFLIICNCTDGANSSQIISYKIQHTFDFLLPTYFLFPQKAISLFTLFESKWKQYNVSAKFSHIENALHTKKNGITIHRDTHSHNEMCVRLSFFSRYFLPFSLTFYFLLLFYVKLKLFYVNCS